ncbi:HEXXH motif-containing putative peptide modification protein [Mesorhizobium sp.]|uniref:aKG-HExxH-type peptide beta-hydroxylase n=1 Tax=Mesorhizobium sp. TaxID=1871066 RepID=UPI0034343F6C
MPSNLLPILRSEGLRPAAVNGGAARLEAVDNLLRQVPDLARIVSRAVRSIHPLAAEPGYDVSHSQPIWRARIFVSFPERQDEIGELRLAESVVHEAMHLHLTNEESRFAFVARSTDTLYSPWMGTLRPVQGVLHGLFVFYCISTFLRRVTENRLVADDAWRYISGRLADIREEILEIDWAALESALTAHGVAQMRLWNRTMPLHQGTPEI